MASGKYDSKCMRAFYDAYGEREWERFEKAPEDRVSLHIHKHYLKEFVKPGDLVLDAGAGPGRFTIELVRLGACAVVGDLSPKQLALNREKVREAGCEDGVLARVQLDIVSVPFGSSCFDVVVCYGGPLSYVMDRADDALKDLLRVLKPGGHLLLSVMSLVGATRWFLPGIWKIIQEHGLEPIERVIQTGNLFEDISSGHRCHMYCWSELKALLERHRCEIVAASASNFLALRDVELLQKIERDPRLWEAFLEWELRFSKEPGALDGGTHILAVARKP